MALNTTITARILRVNHGGEHGAIRIYRAQIAMARLRCPDLVPFLRDTLCHEERHLAAFRVMMPARAAKPCRAMWIWSIGGGLLGVATGLLGREAVLACTEAVETTVHRHLDDQLRYLAPRDADLAALVCDIQAEELGHMTWARAHRKTAGDGGLVHATVAIATESLIWLSTRGTRCDWRASCEPRNGERCVTLLRPWPWRPRSRASFTSPAPSPARSSTTSRLPACCRASPRGRSGTTRN